MATLLPGARNSAGMTPAQTIKQGEQAGLIPTGKPKRAPRRDAKDRGMKAKGSGSRTRRDTPMQGKVRKFERQTAMY